MPCSCLLSTQRRSVWGTRRGPAEAGRPICCGRLSDCPYADSSLGLWGVAFCVGSFILADLHSPLPSLGHGYGLRGPLAYIAAGAAVCWCGGGLAGLLSCLLWLGPPPAAAMPPCCMHLLVLAGRVCSCGCCCLGAVLACLSSPSCLAYLPPVLPLSLCASSHLVLQLASLPFPLRPAPHLMLCHGCCLPSSSAFPCLVGRSAELMCPRAGCCRRWQL